ncbi:HAD family hydrolase [Sphaerisporangium aureirubrum]|uniref:HAD family hydrolase n=1 Tax=Sphaerisporangium aureirubrum TaxID=1544736 RepID=A0ABW1NKZ9_9ACTN
MEAVLFDMDGLLVDTEKYWFQVETDVMRRLGHGWTAEDQERLVGGSMPATVAYMLRVSGSSREPDEIERWMHEGLFALLETGVEMMPGAAELLAEVRAEGLPTALVTSSGRPVADAVLATVGRGNFDAVVTGDDVTRFKPDPEPYLLAARLLGVSPQRCAALEDSPNGVTAATAAGCAVVAVPSVLPVPPAPGRLIVESLKQVGVRTLRELVGG